MGADLQTAGAETDEDLTPDFTLDELLDELGAYIRPRRQAGDLDAGQIAVRYQITRRQALTLMDRIAERGAFDAIVVYDPETLHGIKVLRRKGEQ